MTGHTLHRTVWFNYLPICTLTSRYILVEYCNIVLSRPTRILISLSAVGQNRLPPFFHICKTVLHIFIQYNPQ